MDFITLIELYFLLNPVKILAVAAVILAALTLVSILIVKAVKKKEADAGLKENRMPPASAPSSSMSGADRIIQKKQSSAPEIFTSVQDPRTVLMSYSTLGLLDADTPGRNYRADLRQPVTVGRSSENAVCIADDSVSRHHLRVFRSGAGVYAENLSRMNGTMLEGIRMSGTRELHTGNLLQLGRVRLIVEID